MPRSGFQQCNDITFGVSTASSAEALCLCLTSVLMQRVLPARIHIRFEGALPNFGNFYLEQLACYAKIQGVEWEMFVDKSRGVRYARDWQLANCPTRLLWMGDDDVIYEPDCLEGFAGAAIACLRAGKAFSILAGIKVDASNRRNYPDWDTVERATFVADGPSCLNHFYKRDAVALTPAGNPIGAYLDTGNCVLDVGCVRDAGCRFQMFDDTPPTAGGEDTLFAAYAVSKGLNLFAVPWAQAIHLEKPKVMFDEFAARKELVNRSKQVLGI